MIEIAQRFKFIIIYLVTIFIFSLVYGIFLYEDFRFPENVNKAWFDWLYFSVITITTLGYGDIVPITGWSKTFVIFESLTGLLLLGLFLNDEAHRGQERKNIDGLKNQLTTCLEFLSLMNGHLSYAFNEIDKSDNFKDGFIFIRDLFDGEKQLHKQNYKVDSISSILRLISNNFKSARSNPVIHKLGASQNLSIILASLEAIEAEHLKTKIDMVELRHYYFNLYNNAVFIEKYTQ